MQRIAALMFLSLAACSSRNGPGPACMKFLETVRASCERSGPEGRRRQECVEEATAAQRPQAEWDDAEDVCEARNRDLESLILDGDSGAPARRWESAKTYKFVGALDIFLGKPDAGSTTDPP